jgi:hypothetical protein
MNKVSICSLLPRHLLGLRFALLRAPSQIRGMTIKAAWIIPIFALCSIGAADAATYYNGGNYQQGQYQYNTAPRPYNAQQAPQYNAQSSQRYQVSQQQTAGYSTGTQYNNNMQQRPGQQPQQPRPSAQSGGAHKGFYASAGISHESAVWQFDMKESGSSLHWDNVTWNVIDLNAGYGFDVGNDVGLKLDVGIKFGFQGSESTMVDDDISSGGFETNFYYDDKNGNGIFDAGDVLLGSLVGRALSIGKTSGGSMFGYNIGLGLTDKFQVGNMKITPSLGWRSLSYKLNTKNNNGLALEVLEGPNTSCVTVPGTDEVQCGPAIVIQNGSNLQLVWNGQSTAGGLIDTGNTYFYGQPGTSHDYSVDWSGPYLAVDFDYFINMYNAVNARVELGLPAYTATGNQPYRPDWGHPKSVEDSAGMGSAYHLGLGANWLTALSDSVQLAIGLTYDYYTMSGADAKTFLNGGYYTGLYNTLLNNFIAANPGSTEADALADPGLIGNAMNDILFLQQECPGWVCKQKSEVDSFYRSIGIRVGINAQF